MSRIILLFALTLAVVRGHLAGEALNARAQEQVIQTIQELFGQIKVLPPNIATNSLAVYTNLEARFREASRLLPHRLDLRFGIAAALLGQALQTNAPFDLKMKEVLTVYEEAHALDTNGFQAALLSAAYTRAIRDTNAFERKLARLVALDPARAQAHARRFQRFEEILLLQPNETVQLKPELNTNHAIVILGAALDTNATMKPKLIDRLQQGLTLARLYPDSPVIVTGGNPKYGLTEAFLMAEWLFAEHVTTNRLYLEDQARDTVGNALRSCEILAKLGVTRATLVTSGSHIQRALATFEQAAHNRGLNITFDHLAAKDDPSPVRDPARERVALFRDGLRSSGIWAYPGFQQ